MIDDDEDDSLEARRAKLRKALGVRTAATKTEIATRALAVFTALELSELTKEALAEALLALINDDDDEDLFVDATSLQLIDADEASRRAVLSAHRYR